MMACKHAWAQIRLEEESTIKVQEEEGYQSAKPNILGQAFVVRFGFFLALCQDRQTGSEGGMKKGILATRWTRRFDS